MSIPNMYQFVSRYKNKPFRIFMKIKLLVKYKETNFINCHPLLNYYIVDTDRKIEISVEL
jgi:hypothetical protein